MRCMHTGHAGICKAFVEVASFSVLFIFFSESEVPSSSSWVNSIVVRGRILSIPESESPAMVHPLVSCRMSSCIDLPFGTFSISSSAGPLLAAMLVKIMPRILQPARAVGCIFGRRSLTKLALAGRLTQNDDPEATSLEEQ